MLVCCGMVYIIYPLMEFESRTLRRIQYRGFCMISRFLSIPTVGTGCIVKCVSYAIGREPTVVGKPHKPMLDVIKSR